MDIKPQTTQPISDDQDLAKVLAGVSNGASATSAQPAAPLPPLPDLPPEPAPEPELAAQPKPVCSFIFFNPLKIRKNKIKSDKINKILYCIQNLGHKILSAVHHSPLLFFQ